MSSESDASNAQSSSFENRVQGWQDGLESEFVVRHLGPNHQDGT